MPDPSASRRAADPLRGIVKTYGEGDTAFQALKGVDLDIAAGEFVAIMGPSGSGKSTAMNILGGLDAAHRRLPVPGCRGQSLERDLRALLRRHYLGFVFQGFNLLARTSALENVELPLVYRGERRGAAMPPLSKALEQVGLPGAGHHPRRPNSRRPAAARGDRPRHRHQARLCCSPTSRPATSTASAATRSWS